MSFTSIIFAGLLLIQMFSMNILFSEYGVDYNSKFEEKRLQIVVNYAVDAAAKEMRVASSDLGQDYETMSKINVDPMVALDIFSTVLCKNYNVPVNSTNQQAMMTEYCPLFMVAAYDGYYIANKQDINAVGVQNTIFSPKLPYSGLYIEQDGSTSIYSYNLSLMNATKVDSNGGVYKIETPPLSKAEQSNLINIRLSDVLNDNLLQYASRDPRGTIYIPSEFTTLRATNPIQSTTVFAYIDNFDLIGLQTDLQSFGIGGAEIKNNKVVIGFTINSSKYYAYYDRVPSGTVPIEVFDSQEDAAEAGYYYYSE